MVAGDVRLSAALTSAPRARRPRRRRRAGRLGAGRRRRGPATGSSAPPSSRPSVAQIARSACLPGSSDPMSSRRSTSAPPRVPIRSASRAVIAFRRRRAPGDEERLLDLDEEVAALVRGGAVDAEPDPRAGVEQGAHRRDARAETQVRGRAVRDTRARRREPRDLAVGEVDAVGAPHVVREPAEPLEVLDRRAAVELAAVRLLLDGLGEMRVEDEPEPAGECRGLLHQPSGDGERRAGRDGDLHARAGAVLVVRGVEPLRLGEHRVELLDQLVRRKPAVRHAEVHRAARGDEADAELARRLAPRPRRSRAAAREHVVVVEDGRAAGERELREPGSRRRVLRLGVDPRPHGYSSRSHVKRSACCARARVRVWYRWWWVLTRPGVTTRRRGIDRAGRPSGSSPEPTEAISAPSTSTHPSACSVPASSIVTNQPFAYSVAIAG